MGKKNPLKEVIKGAADLAVAPLRETSRAIGADGIVRGLDDVKDFAAGVSTGAIDLANNEKGKQQKKADAANAEAAKQARNASETAARNQAAADFQASEAERMSAGSKSRTLLTGPAGLDDAEDMSISRRTLRAR
jgi:hypothetical protein